MTATDPDCFDDDAGTPTNPTFCTTVFDISGGVDAARFGITGADINFVADPNFEVPLDGGGNNVYDIQVRVSNPGAGEIPDTENITVTVTDVNELATIVATDFSQPENSAGPFTPTYTVTDEDCTNDGVAGASISATNVAAFC